LRDSGADVEHLKALLAAEINSTLRQADLSLREAQAITGTTAADFSRIRSADLGRFTIDRFILIINRLGARIDVAVSVRRDVDARVD
jgi:predicted XRE-type DNA-binding protein